MPLFIGTSQKQIKKEVRVVSPPQADDLRSHCTEDDIAEQRGLLPSSGTDKQVSINVDNQHVKPGKQFQGKNESYPLVMHGYIIT